MGIKGDSSGMSSWMSAAIKRIREGDTEGQRRAELRNKIVMGALGAGMTGMAALGSKADADAVDRQNKAMAIAKAKASASKARRDAVQSVSTEDPSMPYRTSGDIARQDPYSADGIKSASNAQIDQLAANDAASMAPIAQTWGSSAAFDDADQHAQLAGNDINTGHGMMGSQAAPQTWGSEPTPNPDTSIERKDPYGDR